MDNNVPDTVGEGNPPEFYQRSAIIFLVDFRKSMFEKQDDGDYYFKTCIQAYKSVMISLARKGQRNCATSVVLIGTETSNSQVIPAHIAELQPLGVVDVDRITEVNDMLTDNFSSVITKYGQHNTFRLSAALHHCQIALKKWKSSEYNKSVIIFTDDDKPYRNDLNEAHKSWKQAEDFLLLKIDLNIVPFGNFDGSKFYNELMTIVKDEIMDYRSEYKITLDDVINTVQRIVGRFSCHRRFLYLSKEICIPILLSRPYVEPHTGMKKNNTSDNEGARESETNDDEQEKLPEFPVSKTAVYPFLGRLLPVSKDDMRKLSAKTEVGFRLLGFYPTSEIPEYLSVSPPYLMLPDYNKIGSAYLWTYLLDRCAERELSAICWYMFHKTCPPTLVSLTPYPGDKSSGEKVTPPGFIVSTLPFSDELIEVDDNSAKCELNERQVEAANAIVKKLTIGYSPETFHDYQLRKLMAMTEALALNYDDVEEFEDDTDIDTENITVRLGHLSHEFTDCGYLEENEASSSHEVGKRKGDGENHRRTKVKKPELDLNELMRMVQDGKASKLTVAQLRNILQWEGVKSLSTYTKPKLIELVNLKCKYSQ